MLRYYTYLNKGLVIRYNGKKFRSKDGLKDLLEENLSEDPLYPIVHIEGNDIEVAFTHIEQYGEDYFSFVNGQHTTQGGTHQAAFREGLVKPFAILQRRISTLRILEVGWLLQLVSRYRNRYLNLRLKPNWAH